MSDIQYVKPEKTTRAQTKAQAAVDRATQRFLAANPDAEVTTKDVIKQTKKNKYRTLIALRRLENLGAVERVGKRKTSNGRGRQSITFKANGLFKSESA